jgi:hypothetical protein
MSIGSIIPSKITALSSLRQGISETRCMLKVLEAYNKLGIPTGDLPNGNVNPVILLEKERIKAIFQELRENIKIEVTNNLPIVIPVTVATPAGPGSGTANVFLPGGLNLTGIIV